MYNTGLLLTVLSPGASSLSFRASAGILHGSRNPNRYNAGVGFRWKISVMNDPHVVSLTYELESVEGISYRDPAPLIRDYPAFRLELRDGQLFAAFHDHFPSIEAAREAVEAVLLAWEVYTSLQEGKEPLRFSFLTGEVVDRSPLPLGSQRTLKAEAGSYLMIGADVSLHVTRARYPEPPVSFEVTREVEAMWRRRAGHIDGKEPLLSMAYYCLSLVQRLGGGREGAAKAFSIERAVLDTLGQLTSTRGDAETARKENLGSLNNPLTDSEKNWIFSAVTHLIIRLGEDAAGVGGRLGMQDLPKL